MWPCSFTADPPPEVKYDFAAVPGCNHDLKDSVLLRPSSRRQWFVCLKELESLARESLDRRAARLQARAQTAALATLSLATWAPRVCEPLV